MESRRTTEPTGAVTVASSGIASSAASSVRERPRYGLTRNIETLNPITAVLLNGYEPPA